MENELNKPAKEVFGDPFSGEEPQAQAEPEAQANENEAQNESSETAAPAQDPFSNLDIELDDKTKEALRGVLSGLYSEIEELKKEKQSLSESVRALSKKYRSAEKESKEAKEEAKKYKLKYEKIVRSSDLSEEEKAKYTEEELKLMDEKADMMEAANEAYIAEQKAEEILNSIKEKKTEEAVKAKALELAGNDEDLANKIISNLSKFKGVDLSDEETLNDVMEAAYALAQTKQKTSTTATATAPAGGGPVKQKADSDVKSFVKGVINNMQDDDRSNEFGW